MILAIRQMYILNINILQRKRKHFNFFRSSICLNLLEELCLCYIAFTRKEKLTRTRVSSLGAGNPFTTISFDI